MTFGTTAGIILGIRIILGEYLNKERNNRLDALLAEHAYLAPTYWANSSSSSVTTLSCNKLENSDVSIE
jgi:hypothetical protein